MSLFVLDSDTLSLLEKGHATVSARVASHPAAEISVAVIVVEEALSGWYSMIRKAKNRVHPFTGSAIATAYTI